MLIQGERHVITRAEFLGIFW